MTDHESNFREIDNTHSTISWLEEGIVLIKWKEDTDIEISDIDELEASFNILTNGKRVKVITELSRYVNITTEAKEYGAHRSPEHIGLAYVIQDLSQRMVLRFYFRIRGKKNPTKVFNTKELALTWLRSL